MKQHLNTLYITTDGIRLLLNGETVEITHHGQSLRRIPFLNLEAIQTFGWDIGASPQLMARCSELGINLSFCSPSGHFLCRVCGYTHGNVLLRRQQYRLADDPFSRITIAREMVAAKILNARTVLQRAVRDYDLPDLQPAINRLEHAVRQARQESSEQRLLGIEGSAADVYFGAIPRLITAPGFVFTSRNRRPPTDPFNALLSFVYTLLASDCKSAAEAVGLDSAVGLYHRERPGRPSLALDLMEEFRAPLADRCALTLINRRQTTPDDFEHQESGAVLLSDTARKTVITHWQQRKNDIITHPFLQDKITLGLLPHIQARLLAQHLRGALDAYPPYIQK